MADEPRKFASTQVPLPKMVGHALKSMAKKIDPDHLTEEGVEDEPHVTVKYGLHSDNHQEVRQKLEGEGPVKLKMGKTSIFEADDHDVIKVDVDSPDLHRLNKKIGELPHTDTHPDYKPHATVAYVKSGRGKHYTEDDTLDGQEFSVDTVVFSDTDKKQSKIPLH